MSLPDRFEQVGIVVGSVVLVALPATYHQVWAFSLSSWLLSFAGWALLGLSTPSTNRPLAVLVWAAAIALGAIIAPTRPVRTVAGRLRHA